jgi:hypothetical protein
MLRVINEPHTTLRSRLSSGPRNPPRQLLPQAAEKSLDSRTAMWEKRSRMKGRPIFNRGSGECYEKAIAK